MIERTFSSQTSKGRSAANGFIATGGTQKDLKTRISVFRKRAGTNVFDQNVQPDSVIQLGEELLLRAAINDDDGWKSSHMGPVLITGLNSKKSALLVNQNGCVNSAMKSICPHQPSRVNNLAMELPFRAFLFQESPQGDEMVISVKMQGCLHSQDCPKVDYDDPFPKTICCGCHIQLEATKLFMDLVIQGQEKLRSLLRNQQERCEREEKERLRLEKALKNHNPNASVETYTIQTDENGEKFIIQIYSEGPLFLPDHELSLKAEGLTEPKRKRGRPPKSATNSEPLKNQDEPNAVCEDSSINKDENKTETCESQEISDSEGRRKRKIRAPARYAGVVEGRELDNILKKEGVIDEDVEEDRVKERKDSENVTLIGKVVSNDGSSEESVYFRKRLRRHKNDKSKIYKCDVCHKEFKHVGRYELHKKGHKIKYSCQGNNCQVEDEDREVIVEHQKQTDHVGISRTEQINVFNGKVILPDTDPVPSTEDPEFTTDLPEIGPEEKVINCPMCNKSFSCKQNYEVHLKAIHNGEKPFKCDICERPFAYACSLKKHMISHNKESEETAGQFPCDKCTKMFHHPSSLFYHKEAEHGNQRFICNKCNKTFKHRQLLQRHQLVHSEERPFKCNDCHLTFKSKCNLTYHENIHKGLKNYTCNVCQQSFVHKSSLAMHMRWHEGNKPFECDVCKKAFTQKGNLFEHKRIHTGEKPFTCDVCGRAFTTSSQWKLHKKRHTGEKPYKCEYCHKQFLHKVNFETHIRRHLDIRPYKCAHCDKSFSEAWARQRHQRIHSGDKPYQCAVCDKTFADVSNFNKHTKIHLKNGLKKNDTDITNGNQDASSVNIKIVIPDDAQPSSQSKTDTEVNSSNLQIQEILDSDGNTLSFTTADGQPINIVSSGNEKIQGLMPDGTLVSFDILPENQKNQQPHSEEVDNNQELDLANTGIQFLEENSISNNGSVGNEVKADFLPEDRKVYLITSFDENSFLTMS